MSANGFSYSQDALREIASDILKYARDKGATACETDVSEGVGASVAVRRSEVDTIEYNRDKGIGVTVYVGQQRGYASSSDFSPTALRATVDAALSIARFTAADEYAGLADPELLATEFPDLDLHHPWDLSVEQAIDLARECETAAFERDRRVSNSEGANVSRQESQFVSANSLGFMGGYATTRHSVSCSVIAGEGDGMQRDYWYDSQRDAADLEAARHIGQTAADRAVARLNARRVPTGEVPVIFEAPLAAGLIGSFVHAASGGALYRKSTFLLDSLGKPVFSPCVNISERAYIKKGLGSGPFDDDGVQTRDREVIVDGVLQGYFLSVYSARKLGMQTTGNGGGAHNLLVAPGTDDFDALVRRMGRGLIVTELLGHGINYLTGDYSRGAAGFWVENGQIAHPVEEITIAGNLRDMLLGIEAVGSDVHRRGAKQSGSLLVNRMTIAGT
ncbi:metalloprotease PmbA [Denitromonas iodatirespirans]|uniref:Metalloprotease PmbA n=1 Tax=Denitromonas iodatirespirans TaxID=2795389 RepID=A0A944DBC2_DENI1|nr:metalloprotease PmbA [Denitromonas iodatirespirans]MBT0963374.1 metalloprotease PmbA [Denitromonas iodatirespirans]